MDEAKLTSAVGIASVSRSGDLAHSQRVAAAMRTAVIEAQAKGVDEPDEIRANMMAAREQVYERSRYVPTGEALGVEAYAQRAEGRELIAQGGAQLEVLMALLKVERHIAIGAAAAFLLQAADEQPQLLRHMLTGTRVKRGDQVVNILEAIQQSISR